MNNPMKIKFEPNTDNLFAVSKFNFNPKKSRVINIPYMKENKNDIIYAYITDSTPSFNTIMNITFNIRFITSDIVDMVIYFFGFNSALNSNNGNLDIVSKNKSADNSFTRYCPFSGCSNFIKSDMLPDNKYIAAEKITDVSKSEITVVEYIFFFLSGVFSSVKNFMKDDSIPKT
jgi:hypothetical protein